MQYDGLAWLTALVALLIALLAARVLFNLGWLLGWLRGTLGLAFAALAGVVGLAAYDLTRYSPLPQDKPLVTISFTAAGEQRFEANLLEGGRERQVTLEGDLWQLDARLFGWKGLAELIGLQPGYRLETLSGRYLAIEQQKLALNTPQALAASPYGVDVWRWVRNSGRDFLLFNLQSARVNYLPMAADAVYSVSLTPTGLLAQPMNQAAQQALRDWQ